MRPLPTDSKDEAESEENPVEVIPEKTEVQQYLIENQETREMLKLSPTKTSKALQQLMEDETDIGNQMKMKMNGIVASTCQEVSREMQTGIDISGHNA